MTRTPLSPTPRSTLGRYRNRAAADRAALDAVLDEGLVCHVAVSIDGHPVVLPTAYGRDGDTLYLHGSTGARGLRTAPATDISVCVTLVDGVVYARSAMHFSMNYRSAVVHGRPVALTDPDDKLHGLRAVVEHAAPGSWDHTRPPNRKELAATAVLALDLTEASVKVRSGGPADVAAGTAWAGVLPLQQQWGTPIPATDLSDGMDVPDHVRLR